MLRPGLEIADETALMNVGDPWAWQAQFRFDGGVFGEAIMCTQYGETMLLEIDRQANNGTPTMWRDTLLRENIENGFVAKLRCNLRILRFGYRERDQDALLQSLRATFGDVDVTSQDKGTSEMPYTQHKISARQNIHNDGTYIHALSIIVNDLAQGADNVTVDFILLVHPSDN